MSAVLNVGDLKNATNPQSAALQALNQPPSHETSGMVLAAQAKALVEARYTIAMHRPRDIEVVRQAILRECRRPGFARAARYVKPLGNDKTKFPTGPSIRFAETAIRNMTNITVETNTIYDDREKRIVRVTVADLESNVPYSQDVTIQKTVERKFVKDGDPVIKTRINSYNQKIHIVEATDDDIMNKQNALISKAIRTLGLRLVPGDIIDEAMDLCVQVQNDEDAKDPNTAKRTIIDGFGGLGVSADQIKEYVGHSLDNLQPKELQDLRGLFAALRDNETTWAEIMEARAPGKPTGKPPQDPPRDQKPAVPANPPATEPKNEKPAEKPAAAAPESPPSDEGKPTYEEVIKHIAKAKTLDDAMKLVEIVAEINNEKHRSALTNMLNNRISLLSEPSAPPAVENGKQQPTGNQWGDNQPPAGNSTQPTTKTTTARRTTRSFD